MPGSPPAPGMAGTDAVTGGFVDIDGERCYVIRNVDRMPPFFVSVVSGGIGTIMVAAVVCLTIPQVRRMKDL